MESFKLWLEQNEIQYLGSGKHGGTGWVRFAIRGKRYEYTIDPIHLEPDTYIGKKFHAFIRYAPGRALNLIKKHGELVKPAKTPTVNPNAPNWPEDWELENRKQQARNQGAHIPF